ncbi:hypothetical protein QQP08_004665 [Theobroma cacao]|nr:hypothetical protein QQP08_004665 [Theobroma cacao]
MVYALCGLNLGYRRSERPAIGVGICVSVAIAAPAMAGVYTIVSPLGKDYGSEMNEEAKKQIDTGEIRRPEHFCVFGWNMERLGIGNMYVHIATFLLFCMAPFWVFNLAAVNIDNETVREALSVTGIVLCMFGLLYGGFWRIQMRKRFNLPACSFCFGQPAAARTWNSYDIVEDKFKEKQMDNGSQQLISPSPREDRIGQFSPSPSSSPGYNSSPSRRFSASSSSPRIVSKEYYSPERQLSMVKEESFVSGKDETMIPPDIIRRHFTSNLYWFTRRETGTHTHICISAVMETHDTVLREKERTINFLLAMEWLAGQMVTRAPLAEA